MIQGGMNSGGTGNAMMNGAAAGSVFGPWGAVAGAALGAASSYLSGRSKKKALNKKKKMCIKYVWIEYEYRLFLFYGRK